MELFVLIPAYKPDDRLCSLVASLKEKYRVVVVDDGGGSQYGEIFATAKDLGAVVLTHEVNRGKGAAIKTGLAYAKDQGADGVITADADGQHTPGDIDRIAEAMAQNPDSFVVGGRDFSQMPPRSKFGNTVTRAVFRLATGVKISDTQSGLRGLPACLFDRMLAVDGDRYEYEMNVLLSLRAWHASYLEIPIETVYIDNNSSSHFHAVRDGLKVFSRVLKYAASSVACTVIDYALYCLLLLWIPAPYAYGAARVVSASINYQLCRRVVFHAQAGVKSAVGYFALAACSMLIGSVSVSLLSGIGLNSVLAKLIMDCLLFVMNYLVQKHVIFRSQKA